MDNNYYQRILDKNLSFKKVNVKYVKDVPTAKPVEKKIPEKKENLNKYSGKVQEFWPQIVNEFKKNGKIVLYTNLVGTTAVEINDMTIGIEFPNGMTAFGKTVLEKQENIKEITNLVSMACGKPMQIKYIEMQKKSKHTTTNEENIQNIANQSDIPFNIID